MTIRTMRSCNFFHADVRLFSGGANRVGSLMMTTGTTQFHALNILKDNRLAQLLYIKSFLPKEQLRKVLDIIIT